MKKPDPHLAAVKGRFDKLAERYDKTLETAKLFAPELILDAFLRHAHGPLGSGPLTLLDLGCGTGLCGQAFRPHVAQLDGVDLSDKMLEKAALLGIYDSLTASDVVGHLGRTDSRYDVVTCSSVFLYFDDLQPALAGSHRVLRPGGFVIFTADRHDGGAEVEPNPRNPLMFTHSRGHVERAVHASGLRLTALEEVDDRLAWKDLKPVPAFIAVARRAAE